MSIEFKTKSEINIYNIKPISKHQILFVIYYIYICSGVVKCNKIVWVKFKFKNCVMNSKKWSKKKENIQSSKNIWGWGGIVKTFQPLEGHFLPWSFSINLMGKSFREKRWWIRQCCGKISFNFFFYLT